ncbi:MAG: hypothetical protein NZM38_00290 [Cytophagales bacterium]|nr:hypothetical protein [Cytophagales bacterium]MDW8383187.1 Sip1-related alpha-galactosidase [Flammeovirgaceae bacterium]
MRRLIFIFPGFLMLGSCSLFDKKLSLTCDSQYEIIQEKISTPQADFFKIELYNSKQTEGDTVRMYFEELSDFLVGLAFYRYGPWKAWTKPIRIDSFPQLPANDVQCFLWKSAQNTYGAIVPLCGNGFRTTIGQQSGKIVLESAMGVKRSFEKFPAAVVGYGKNPYTLLEAVYENAMKIMGRPENLRKKKLFPQPFEYIGYCTWNAMYDQMSEEKIIQAIDFFCKNDFPIGNLLIDDGWLDMQPERKLYSFRPEKSRFPNGFQNMIFRLKKEKGLRNVGVWHTLNAYWKGLHPKGELYAQYPVFTYLDQETWLLEKEGIDTFHIADPRTDKGFKFFEDWYKYLSSQGVSFVKVDNQLITERIAKGQVPIFELAEKLHRSFHQAANQYFNDAVINCMDMTNDAYYNFGNSAVARTVEDFFPYKEDETYDLQHGNAAAHVTSAVYNALWFGQMVYTDFDMFQSHHPHAEYHAIARALSGGPIYVTDVPGQQNFDILRKLVIYDGRILRSDAPLVPTEDCLFQVQGSGLLKTFSYSGNAALLAIFHATDAENQQTEWKIRDIPRFQEKEFENQEFVFFDFKAQKLQKVIQTYAQKIELPRMGVALYWIFPKSKSIIPLGLLNKYNGVAAVQNIRYQNNACSFDIKDGGIIGIYADTNPMRVKVDEQVVEHSYENGLVKISLPSGRLYQVTVE